MKIRYLISIVLLSFFAINQLSAQLQEVVRRYNYKSFVPSQVVAFELRKNNDGDIQKIGPDSIYSGWIKGCVVISERKLSSQQAEDLCLGDDYNGSVKYYFASDYYNITADPCIYIYMMRRHFYPENKPQERFKFELSKYKLNYGLFRLRIFKLDFGEDMVKN